MTDKKKVVRDLELKSLMKKYPSATDVKAKKPLKGVNSLPSASVPKTKSAARPFTATAKDASRPFTATAKDASRPFTATAKDASSPLGKSIHKETSTEAATIKSLMKNKKKK